jgi:hypothetical protein
VARADKNIGLAEEQAISSTEGVVSGLREQAENLATHQRHRANEVDLSAKQKKRELEQQHEAQDAAEVARRAASEEALNLQALRESVPTNRTEAITETGHAGYNQARKQINEAYDEAWDATIAPGTLGNVIKEAKRLADLLPEQDARLLNRVVSDAKKLKEKGGNPNSLDSVIRRAGDSATDIDAMDDLTALRGQLRSGLPDENIAMLDDVDAVYPNFLTVQKATAKADAPEGLTTPEGLTAGSKVVGGEVRSAAATRPLKETIDAGTPSAVEVDRIRKMEKQALQESIEAERANVRVVSEAEKRRLAQATDEAREKVEETRRTATNQAQSRRRRLDKSVLAKYADDPPKAIKQLVKSNNVDELERLYRYMEANGQGAAFKSQIGEELRPLLGQKDIMSSKIAGSQAENANKIRQRLEQAGVISPEESANMHRALGRTARMEDRARAVKHTLDQEATWQEKLIPSFAAAASLSALPGSHQLLVGGAVRRMFSSVLRKRADKKAIDAIEDFIANPEKYLDAVDVQQSVDGATRAIVREVLGRSVLEETMLGEEEENAQGQ